jgi:hypothetical protein
MVAFEVVTSILLAGLAVVAVFGLVAGALGLVGVVRFTRCGRCGRVSAISTARPFSACVWCDHTYLAHPLASLHQWEENRLHAQKK